MTLTSCGGKSYEERQQELLTEKQNYENGLNSSHKTIISNVLDDDNDVLILAFIFDKILH